MFVAGDVNYVSDGTFTAYVVALIVVGVLQIVIAGIGFGSSIAPRVICAVVGLIFLGYGVYLQFFLPAGKVFAMYPFAFILPLLAIGYLIQSRMVNREDEAAVRAQLAAEKADRTHTSTMDSGTTADE
jgi:hypothetical protein